MTPRPVIVDKQAAKRLVIVRKYLKLSQVDIAAACGTIQPTISKMELGILDMQQFFIKALFFKFNISPTYLIAGEGPIEYKKEDKTLITDTRELRLEIEVLRGELLKMKQDIRILSQQN